MRLTCPNCGAQYEVPDDVIPEAGRDVQCSNCGDTWFQHHADHVPADEAPAPDAWEDAPPPPQDESDADDDGWSPAEAPPLDIQDMPEDAPAASETPGTPERRRMDPELASVLREEAEREARARAAEKGGIEMQPDLGLDEGEEVRRGREARERMARLRGEDERRDIDPTSRRSLFPDIEEINSSLEPGVDPQADMDMPDPYPEGSARPGGGFRRGFGTVLVIAVAALLLYLFAPALSRMVPALAGVLGDYAQWVDGLRLWLDGQIAAVMSMMDGTASEGAAPDLPATDTAPEATAPEAEQTGGAAGSATDG